MKMTKTELVETEERIRGHGKVGTVKVNGLNSHCS